MPRERVFCIMNVCITRKTRLWGPSLIYLNDCQEIPRRIIRRQFRSGKNIWTFMRLIYKAGTPHDVYSSKKTKVASGDRMTPPLLPHRRWSLFHFSPVRVHKYTCIQMFVCVCLTFAKVVVFYCYDRLSWIGDEFFASCSYQVINKRVNKPDIARDHPAGLPSIAGRKASPRTRAKGQIQFRIFLHLWGILLGKNIILS